MKAKILRLSKEHPISVVILIALAARVIAAVFSNGFGFESEYFYVETPNAWLDNIDGTGYDSPRGISLLYVSINYLIFGFFKLFGISNPQWLMFFSRLIHGVVSVTVVTLGYRIAKLIVDKRLALNIAWVLALLWFMPYVGVHSLAQTFSLPFLLYGTLLITKQERLRNESRNDNLHRTSFFIAGIFFALGFSIWYLGAVLYLAIIVVLSARKNIKGAAVSLAAFLPTAGTTQTIPDFIVWGRPFAEFRAFLNDGVRFSYPLGYYILALLTILIIAGFIRFYKNGNRLKRYICAACVVINMALLAVTTIMYSNKPEVKAMTYLSKDKDMDLFIVEDVFSDETKRPPVFYEKNWTDYIIVNQQNKDDVAVFAPEADHIIFRENKNLEDRVEQMKKHYPNLKHEVTYKPFFAYIMYKWLNHSTTDGCVSIYKVSHEH